MHTSTHRPTIVLALTVCLIVALLVDLGGPEPIRVLADAAETATAVATTDPTLVPTCGIGECLADQLELAGGEGRGRRLEFHGSMNIKLVGICQPGGSALSPAPRRSTFLSCPQVEVSASGISAAGRMSRRDSPATTS